MSIAYLIKRVAIAQQADRERPLHRRPVYLTKGGLAAVVLNVKAKRRLVSVVDFEVEEAGSLTCIPTQGVAALRLALILKRWSICYLAIVRGLGKIVLD